MTLNPQDGDALVTASPRLCGDRLDREPAIALALLIGGDVQPPDACTESVDLVLGSKPPITNPATRSLSRMSLGHAVP